MFRPDLDICELVFRAWPNKPATALPGNRLWVRSGAVDGQATSVRQLPGGAPRGVPGTLVEVALPRCVSAGTTVTADLQFDVQLGAATDERIGYSPDSRIAWLGSAFPLLAWQNGRGWIRDDAVQVVGESATSEVFQLTRLSVTAPDRFDVAALGQAHGALPGPRAGERVHTFSADAVRDVTVTVGDISITRAPQDDVEVVVATPRSGRTQGSQWAAEITRLLGPLRRELGPIPYRNLWISVLPEVSDGVEYGGAIQFGDVAPSRQRWLLAHELAHMWFYGLVGNNQAQDPWLDEAFATFVQEVVEPVGNTTPAPRRVPQAIGDPMSRWVTRPNRDEAYVQTVYGAGGEVLLRARQAVGADPFRTALQRYLVDNAHRIAGPSQVRAAWADLPAVIELLEAAGALRPE